jgi:phage shock protein C
MITLAEKTFLFLYSNILSMKRLVKGEKKIFGVCSGLGNYFDIDPTIVRAIFLFAAVVFGSGILLYLILAIVMPDKESIS